MVASHHWYAMEGLGELDQVVTISLAKMHSNCHQHLSSNKSTYILKLVKVQFRGPKLYKERGTLFQEESYLLTIFKSSSLNLHTFHLINNLFWWQIFFRNHGKSTLAIGKTTIFWSSTLWSLSQSHVAKHDNHVLVMPLIGSELAVMLMQWSP